ncbi:MAG: glycosyltransferase family 39 protein [Proteobacteria bacterium]|nr:glycosyltransferase family 39 protein [Pseudomonadota bacterium]
MGPIHRKGLAGVFKIREGHDTFIWVSLLCLALVLRIMALLSLKNSVYFDYLLFDERIYHDWAMKIMDGTFVSQDVYEFAPLYAYLMALVYLLFSPDVILVRVLNVMLGTGTCLFTGLAGKELGGKKIGFLSFLVASCYGPFIFYSIVVLKTALSLFLFSLFIWQVFRVQNRPGRLKALALGITAGLMMNVRPNYMLVFPVAAAFLLFGGRRDSLLFKQKLVHLLLFLVGLALALSPFVIRNYKASGKLALMASQSGFNLFIGNNPDNPGPYYRPVPFASSSPFEQGIHFNIEASKRAGKKLSPTEASGFWSREVIRIAMEHPLAFGKKLAGKTQAYVNAFEQGDHYQIGFMGDFVTFFKAPLIPYWLVLPFALVGMVAGVLKNSRILAGMCIYGIYGLGLVIFFCNTRYRLPMLVILIPSAVFGALELLAAVRGKNIKKTVGMILGLIMVWILANLPLPGAYDLTAYYNTHAIILKSLGRADEARVFWEKSSAMNGTYSVYANLSLASYYRKKNEYERSRLYLDRISVESFGASQGFEMLGDMMQDLGDMDKAEAYYRKSLEINSGDRGTWNKLIRLLEKKDPEKTREAYEHFKIIQSFYP